MPSSSSSSSPLRPLSSRPLDAAYIAWFVLHLLIMFCVDLVPMYPSSMVPQPLLDLRSWYIVTYNDRFFISPPAWFKMFGWMEALYHVPLSVWAVGALWRDDPLVPLHLLVWSLQTFLTTLVCIVDYNSWGGITATELKSLNGMYVPYLGLAALMGLHMFSRLHGVLVRQTRPLDRKKE